MKKCQRCSKRRAERESGGGGGETLCFWLQPIVNAERMTGQRVVKKARGAGEGSAPPPAL